MGIGKAISYSCPIIFDSVSDESYLCESIGRRVTFADLVLALRDSSHRSYAISHPCINRFQDAKEERVCGGIDIQQNEKEKYVREIGKKETEIKPCVNHYRNLVKYADLGQIPIIDIKDLNGHETQVARLPEKLYWKYAKGKKSEIKEIFFNRIKDHADDLEGKIRSDIKDIIVTRKRMLEFIKDKGINLKNVDFKREPIKYSFTENMYEALEGLDLVSKKSLIPIQIEGDGIAWYLSAETTWDKEKYLVMEVEDDVASVGVVSKMKYSSSVVDMNEKRVEITKDEILGSPKRMLAKVAYALNSIRWEEATA